VAKTEPCKQVHKEVLLNTLYRNKGGRNKTFAAIVLAAAVTIII
jgi:hypothetical protein